MPFTPAPVVIPATLPSEVGNWAATTAYQKNQVFTAPTGERREVIAVYTSGSSYGATDTSNSVSLSQSNTTLDARFAPLGASYKMLVAAAGDTVSSGMALLSNGIPIVTTCTVADLEIDLDYPALGGSTSWTFTRYRYSDQSNAVIGVVTVAAGARSATAAGAGLTNTGLLAGDRILVKNTASNGTTFAGQGVQAFLSMGGTLPVMVNPGNPGTPTNSATSTAITVTWTSGTGATSYMVLRDSVPAAITSNLSYVDANLSSGESHVYSVASLAPGGISAISSTTTGTTTASYPYWNSSADAASSGTTADWIYNLGANSGTALSITGSPVTLTVTSGNTGGGVSGDRVWVGWNKNLTTYSALRRTWDGGWNGSTAITDLYFSSNFTPASTGATSFTGGVQFELQPSGHRIGFKGSSPYTSFQNLTITGGGATTTSATGNVAWAGGVMTSNGSTFAGFGVELLPTSGGAQTVNLYQGTTAQRAAGTMPLVNSVTLSSAQRGSFATGYHGIMMLGAQGTGANNSYLERNVTLTPLSPAGS